MIMCSRWARAMMEAGQCDLVADSFRSRTATRIECCVMSTSCNCQRSRRGGESMCLYLDLLRILSARSPVMRLPAVLCHVNKPPHAMIYRPRHTNILDSIRQAQLDLSLHNISQQCCRVSVSRRCNRPRMFHVETPNHAPRCINNGQFYVTCPRESCRVFTQSTASLLRSASVRRKSCFYSVLRPVSFFRQCT